MTALLRQLCNKHFIISKASSTLTSCIETFKSKKNNTFVILEENNQFVGILSPHEMDAITEHPELYKDFTCKEAIRTNSEVITSMVHEDDMLQRIVENKIDYLILRDNTKYLCLITPIDLLKHNLLLDEVDNEESEDIRLLKELRKSEDKYHFPIVNDAIIMYEPIQPIPLSLPIKEFTNQLRKCNIKKCNSLYANLFGLTKKDLINKQTLGDRIGTNEINLKMLNYILDHHYRADNIVSYEVAENGIEKWFINHTFFEVENDCVVGVWSRKRDITEIKRMETESLQYQEQFNEMFEQSSDSMFIIQVLENNDFQYVNINPMCEKTMGISKHEALNKTFTQLFPDGSGKKMIDSLNRCLRENKSVHIEIELSFPAGTKYFAATLVPVHCQQGKIIQIIGTAVNITDKKRIEENLRRLNWALLALSNGNSAISRSTSEVELIQSCCESITNQNELYPVCCVFEVTDLANQPLKIYTLSGNGHLIYNDQELEPSGIPGQDCILKSVFSKNPEQQNIALQNKFSNSNASAKILIDNNINSVLALPLAAHAKVNFVLAIYSQYPDAFKETEIRMFQELGQNIILGIAHRRAQLAYEDSLLEKEQQALKLQHSLQNTVTALGSMLEHRDPFTSGHQKRVADLAVAIAEVYGLDPERIHWLDLAACVHDIGKITVPSEILSKPYKLTAPEFALVKTHPEIGYQVLKDIEFPGPIAEIVHQHHEYLDGSGYPFGLKGNEIMLESKILTVADIVEAMASHRPYRPAFGVDIALNEIRKMRGIKLDPKAVDICISLFEKNNYQFPEVDHFNRKISLQRSDISRSQR